MGSWNIVVILLATVARIAFANYDPTANTSWVIDFGTGGTIPSADDDDVLEQNVGTGPSYSTLDPSTGDFYMGGDFESERSHVQRTSCTK
jgi:hypothetical protein